MQKILDAPLEMVTTGLTPGINSQDAPFWKDARNVHFTAYGAEAQHGYAVPSFDAVFFDSVAGNFDAASGLFDLAGGSVPLALSFSANKPIRGLMTYRLATGLPRTVWGTVDKIWKWDGGANADEVQSGLTGYPDESSGNLATLLSMIPWGDWFITTNSIDPIKIYKTGASMATIGGTPPTRARCLAKLGPHVLAFNTNLGPNIMQYSAEDNPEQWDNGADVTAGILPVRDLENEILAAVQLGNAIAVYSLNEMQLIQYLGGVFQFGSQPLLDGIGALSVQSIVSVGRINYGLYFNGIFKTDGSSTQTITTKVFDTWMENNVNFAQKSKIYGWHDSVLHQVRWAVPLIGSSEPNFIIGYNYITGSFSLYDQGVTAATTSSVFRYSTVGTAGGKLFFAEANAQMLFDGATINAFAQTKELDMDAPDIWKTLQMLKLTLKDLSSTGLFVELGWQEKLTDAIAWSTPVAISNINTEIWDNFGAVYLSLRFSSQDPNANWTLEKLAAFGVVSGQRF